MSSRRTAPAGRFSFAVIAAGLLALGYRLREELRLRQAVLLSILLLARCTAAPGSALLRYGGVAVAAPVLSAAGAGRRARREAAEATGRAPTFNLYPRLLPSRAAAPRRLTQPRIRLVQQTVLAGLLRRLGLEPTDEELELLSEYASAAWLLRGLYRSAGYRRPPQPTATTARRLALVLPPFVASLSVQSRYLERNGGRRRVTFRNLYPSEVRREERVYRRAARHHRARRGRRSLEAHWEARRLSSYLAAVSVMQEGHLTSRNQAVRLLSGLERIHRLTRQGGVYGRLE